MKMMTTVKYHSDIAADVKQLVPVRLAAEHYGFTPSRTGYICCPFHSEKTASLKLYDGDGGFCCFGCGAQGSVIDFVMRLFDIGFRQAVLRLDMDFSLNLTGTKPDRAARSKILEERRREQARRRKLEAEINALSAEHLRLYQNMMRRRPSDPGEEFDPLYVEAVKRLAVVQYQLEELENELGRVIREHTNDRRTA